METLVTKMRAHGWVGRPLLVEEVRPFEHAQYFAWTGSHRIAAATQAGLSRVPCRVLLHGDAEASFRQAGYDQDGYSSWRDALTAHEGRNDRDRLRGLEKANLEEAARMLREELAAEDGHGA